MLVSVDLPRPGDELGNYVIERQLGQGGMAVVYEARHRVIGKRVALKMLMPHHAANLELAQRFQREGEAAAMLEHPNAVSVLDGGSDARGTPYLVLEYLEGEDLGTVLSREGKLSVEETVDVLVPMIAAIAAAHDLGIVHRDLKPENLFLARRHGRVVPKVLDFGISKMNETESLKLTRSESLLGTPHYMSPEQAQGAAQADARTDQFAIGVMLYECVTGRCPFEGNSLFAVLAAIVGGTLVPPSELVGSLDADFEATVTRALSKEPEDRFPDLRVLGSALLPHASARTQLIYECEFGFASRALPRPGRPALAAPSLPPEPMSARKPVLMGSALALAAVAASLTVTIVEDEDAVEPSAHVGTRRSAKPTPAVQTSAPIAARAGGTNSVADHDRTDNIEAPRKKSGLHYEPVETPSLCVSQEETE